MASKNDEDDLYGDLDFSLDAPEQDPTHKKRRAVGSTEHGRPLGASAGSSKLQEENELLKRRIKMLEEENLRLKRNMGTLFRTAKHEIKRKDEQIERLIETNKN